MKESHHVPSPEPKKKHKGQAPLPATSVFGTSSSGRGMVWRMIALGTPPRQGNTPLTTFQPALRNVHHRYRASSVTEGFKWVAQMKATMARKIKLEKQKPRLPGQSTVKDSRACSISAHTAELSLQKFNRMTAQWKGWGLDGIAPSTVNWNNW